MDRGSSLTGKIRNISELARLAGVSTGTVSRALADKEMVKPETRERIQALAREHGFRLNQMARRLRVQETRVIGLVVPMWHEQHSHMSEPFFMTLLGHLADALADADYDLMLCRAQPDTEDWLERIVSSGMVDGLLVMGQSHQVETLERVAQDYHPMVIWGNHRPGLIQCTVGSDDRKGGRQAGDCLIEGGRKRIAFLGNIDPPSVRERYAGVCDAAAAAGIAAPLLLPTRFLPDYATVDVGARLDEFAGQFDGIVVPSDSFAVRAVRALADRGLRVPDDIAVVGFDNLPIGELCIPRLTTIDHNLAGGARTMISTLFARIAGEDAPSVVMDTRLVRRETA